MLLGDLLRELEDEMPAMGTLAAMNDLLLLARVRDAASPMGETPGEYAANSVRAFANNAGDEDWLALMTAIENSGDAGQTCLSHMINWALRRDTAPRVHQGCMCGGQANQAIISRLASRP
jgi:hypothetical protein